VKKIGNLKNPGAKKDWGENFLRMLSQKVQAILELLGLPRKILKV